MEFTYSAYTNMLKLLRDNGYNYTDYNGWADLEPDTKCVILRHDIDFSITKAVDLAHVEAENGVSSTYYVLLTSDLYNVFSKRNKDYLRTIASLGHNVGLHFDETVYPDIAGDIEAVAVTIKAESKMLEQLLERNVDSFSMHRPARNMLDANITIPGLINSYSRVFFNEFKYISDSRKTWREPVTDIITSGSFKRLHILTHAFWYDEDELSTKESLLSYISEGDRDRQLYLKENITSFDEIMDGI